MHTFHLLPTPVGPLAVPAEARRGDGTKPRARKNRLSPSPAVGTSCADSTPHELREDAGTCRRGGRRTPTSVFFFPCTSPSSPRFSTSPPCLRWGVLVVCLWTLGCFGEPLFGELYGGATFREVGCKMVAVGLETAGTVSVELAQKLFR